MSVSPTPTRSLDGAHILIVGASGGLGRPLAAALTARGAQLALAGRDRSRLMNLGVTGQLAFTFDLADSASAQPLVFAASGALGGLDGIVCCAGAVAFGRPLHGEPPRMRAGLDPVVVVDRLLRAIEFDERDVPASSFTP